MILDPANTVTNFSGNSCKNILPQTTNPEVVNLDDRNSEKSIFFFFFLIVVRSAHKLRNQ